MPKRWEIIPDWEHLATGTPEECACFSALAIYVDDHCLSEGQDSLANRLRKAPYLSAYHLAEWLAWNWWRLRWEPYSRTVDWALSHRMSSIGSGYIWPDLTFSSDGEQLTLVARATAERPETLFRYINNHVAVLPVNDFEAGVDQFVTQVLERLDAQGVRDSNLALIWSDLMSERSDPEMGFQRKLEALMGCDADEAPEELMSQLSSDAREFGHAAVQELAASFKKTMGFDQIRSTEWIKDIARQQGHSSSPDDRVCSAEMDGAAFQRCKTPAWKLGAYAAQLLRKQEAMGADPIGNETLAAMMGTGTKILHKIADKTDAFAFVLDDPVFHNSIVLRARGETGRRFELARLLGDCLMPGDRKKLYPATVSYTYQQKLQRAFAAELLCPFNAARDMLAEDYSDENIHCVAEHFKVSDLTVRTQLVNNHLLERSELDDHQFTFSA